MQSRARNTVQNLGGQLFVGAKNVGVSVGNQLVNLTQQDTPNYTVSTAASMLFGSIYLMSSDDARVATALALLGFAGSTYMAIVEYGLMQKSCDAAVSMAKNTYQAASNKMITLFKSLPGVQAENPQEEETNQIESKIKKQH